MTPTRPKYQVFISSTYKDLHEERAAVVWQVLKLNYIPVGMESFPATDDRGWKTIRRTIDGSDYYVLLLAGTYGTVDEKTGLSWTEQEYDYAVGKGIPVLAFPRSPQTTTVDKADTGPLAENLKAFAAKVQSKHHWRTWRETNDLCAEVGTALSNHVADDENDPERTRPGWIRGTEAVSAQVTSELAALSAENRALKERLAAIEVRKPDLRVVRAKAYVPGRSEHMCIFYFDIENAGDTSARDLLVEIVGSGFAMGRACEWRNENDVVTIGNPSERGLVSQELARRVGDDIQFTQNVTEVRMKGSCRLIPMQLSGGGIAKGGTLKLTVRISDGNDHLWELSPEISIGQGD